MTDVAETEAMDVVETNKTLVLQAWKSRHGMKRDLLLITVTVTEAEGTAAASAVVHTWGVVADSLGH